MGSLRRKPSKSVSVYARFWSGHARRCSLFRREYSGGSFETFLVAAGVRIPPSPFLPVSAQGFAGDFRLCPPNCPMMNVVGTAASCTELRQPSSGDSLDGKGPHSTPARHKRGAAARNRRAAVARNKQVVVARHTPAVRVRRLQQLQEQTQLSQRQPQSFQLGLEPRVKTRLFQLQLS